MTKCNNCGGTPQLESGYTDFKYQGSSGNLIVMTVYCNHCGKNTEVKMLVIE